MLALGGIFSLGAALLILLLGAAAVSSGLIREGLGEHMTVVACAAGCLLGGMFVGARLKGGKMLVGMGTGTVCFLIILACSLLRGGEPDFGGRGLEELAACLCGGTLSSFFGKKKKKKGKKGNSWAK